MSTIPTIGKDLTTLALDNFKISSPEGGLLMLVGLAGLALRRRRA